MCIFLPWLMQLGPAEGGFLSAFVPLLGATGSIGVHGVAVSLVRVVFSRLRRDAHAQGGLLLGLGWFGTVGSHSVVF